MKVAQEVARHFLHEVANFLSLAYLAESRVNVERLERLLLFGRSVYCDRGLEKALGYNLLKSDEKVARGISCVLWRIQERGLEALKIEENKIEHSGMRLDLDKFAPAKYLAECGYTFQEGPNLVTCLTRGV